MSASDQPRFLFWLVTAFVIAFLLYGISSLLLPRLIRFNQLPETGELYVDNADALATRIAYGVCNLWISRSSFNKGFDSVSQYKSTSGSAGRNEIANKITDTECKDLTFGKELIYTGDTIEANKKTYDVTISLTNEASLIGINVKKK